MIKFCSLLSFLLLYSIVSMAQSSPEHCGTNRQHEYLMSISPEYRNAVEENERMMQQASSQRTEAEQGIVYKIPVVVHIMHLGTPVGVGANISDEQVYSAIESLNNAYRKKAGTAGDGGGVDTEIEFCLAQKDPSGFASTGIIRNDLSANSTYSQRGVVTGAGGNEVSIKSISKWPNSKYYNLWIVTEIDDNDGGAGIQGFAYFPGAPSNYDGAVILYNAFGFDPTGEKGFNLKSYTNHNATTIHELGHGFNLYHTFEGDAGGTTCPTSSNCASTGDRVCDTPPHIRSGSSCTVGVNSCDGDDSNEEHIHNYMDYSGDECQNEFTTGQSSRMRTSLVNDRSNLISGTNLTECGCDGSVPVVRFTADILSPCSGETVQFTDASINFPATWEWTFQGGTPSTSTAQNPQVTFTGNGPFDVTLTVNSSQGGATLTKTDYIVPVTTLPDGTQFDEGDYPPEGWIVDNPDGGITWSKVANTSIPESEYSLRVRCLMYSDRGQKDKLISPTYDLTGMTNPVLTFNVAYKVYHFSFEDSLVVMVADDCSGEGTRVYEKTGATLATVPSGTSEFVPTSFSDWRKETIDLSAYVGQQVKIIIMCINDYGNNVYIDDISIQADNAVSAVNNAQHWKDLILYPNPVNTILNVEAGNMTFDLIEVYDARGMLMQRTSAAQQPAGINVAGWQKGIYLLKVQSGVHIKTQTFIVE